MGDAPIMYVCEPCQENAPEQCGYSDPSEVRQAPNGTWICSMCHEHYNDIFPDEEAPPTWGDLPQATASTQREQELQSEVERMRAALDDIATFDPIDAALDPQWVTRIAKRALSGQTPPAVKVKRLEWEPPAPHNNRCWVARTNLGIYSVCNEGGWYAHWEPFGCQNEWHTEDHIPSEDGAKAAANAHFTSLINACLEVGDE